MGKTVFIFVELYFERKKAMEMCVCAEQIDEYNVYVCVRRLYIFLKFKSN